jgi:hypothetical protein
MVHDGHYPFGDVLGYYADTSSENPHWQVRWNMIEVGNMGSLEYRVGNVGNPNGPGHLSGGGSPHGHRVAPRSPGRPTATGSPHGHRVSPRSPGRPCGWFPAPPPGHRSPGGSWPGRPRS